MFLNQRAVCACDTKSLLNQINLSEYTLKKINVMKRIFTFAIALMSLFASTQLASAATAVFNVTVPAGTNACYMMGSINSWDLTKAIKLTKVDATHYTVTLDEATFDGGVTLATMQYKYISGPGDWAYVEKHADGSEIRANRVYTGTNAYVDPNGVNPSETAVGTLGQDVVVKWAMAWADVPPLPLNVTIDVLVPAGTIQCYIVGTFNSWAGPTAPADSVKMVKVATNDDGTMIFEKKIFTADANKLAYHFCAGPDWSFEQSAPTGDYHYPEVAPVVTAWKAVYDPTKLGNITFIVNVPANTTAIWAVGSFQGWSQDNGVPCTKNNDGTFSFTAKNVQSMEFKMYNRLDASWGYVEVDAAGVEVKNRVAVSTPGTTVTQTITVIGWKQAANTAVQAINMDNYRIYTANHSVVVEGVTSQVDIYDASGRSVQSQKVVGTFSSKNLSSGLYIIRVDGATTKVSLR